jgi:hypothetical protein
LRLLTAQNDTVKRLGRIHLMNLSFVKFTEVVDKTDPNLIDAMTSTHRRVARTHPTDPDAVKIMEFDEFLSSGIAPASGPKQNRQFYRRTTERLIRASILPRAALNQFEE